jgi:hypothetical protein
MCVIIIVILQASQLFVFTTSEDPINHRDIGFSDFVHRPDFS